jgi:hypothetical protein
MSKLEVNKIDPQSGTDLELGTSGDTITIPAGVTFDSSAATTTLPDGSVTNDQLVNDSITIDGTAIALGGTVSTGTAWQSVTTGTTLTAVAGRGYWINTTSNACTITLPASASVGDTIIFADYARTWGTNAVTINQNSLNFQGNTSPNPIYNTDGQSVTITYSGATQGWIPTVDDDVSLETPQPYSVDFLVVAGGGGGGIPPAQYTYAKGGGGAGGYRTSTQTVTVGTAITITVGDGGGAGSAGSNSSFSGSGLTTITSAGGGTPQTGSNSGGSGGSGSGANANSAPNNAGGSGNTPSTSPSQGNNGGSGTTAANTGGGGGGGANTVGSNGVDSIGGNGGNGTASSITGSSITYAGGGGGGAGFSGGGGAGSGTGNGTAGTVNLGGGGGGCNGDSTSGAGGKGVVILSMPSGSFSGTVTGSPVESISGANKILTFTGTGSYTT